MRQLPPPSFIAECFTVRADGALIWKQRPAHHFPALKSYGTTNSRCAGKEAGTLDREQGYVEVTVRWNGERYGFKAHRIVWLLTHGYWPNEQIDHINGIRADNRPENLRDVSSMQNGANLHGASRNNKLGLLGVHQEPDSGKFVAQIRRGGRKVWLGRFGTAEEAREVYQVARSEVMLEVGL